MLIDNKTNSNKKSSSKYTFTETGDKSIGKQKIKIKQLYIYKL